MIFSRAVLTFIFFFYALILRAQTDTVAPVSSTMNPDIIENFIEDAGDDGNFDFNTAFEEMSIYAEKKLNINKASAADLGELNILNDLQIQNLLNYRNSLGDFITIYELQAVPTLDLQTIRELLPFVTTNSGIDDIQLSIFQMMAKGKSDLYLRWGRFLEEQRGYIVPEDTSANYYLGDPNRLYVRYYKNFENKLTFGFTAEKDPGEEFFRGSNKQGFDYYSAHFFLKDYNRLIKTVAIGDYTASFGQGLILYSGFGRGKSPEVLKIKRNRRPIRKYSSVNEANFLRGAAVELGLSKNINFTTLFSLRQRDANLPEVGDLLDPDVELFTSLQASGNHRTAAEIADERSVRSTKLGGSLAYHKNNFKLAFNGLYGSFDRSFNRNVSPYNQFFFSGRNLLNLSIDYSYVFRNINIFGETAHSDNGAVATTNGLIAALDRRIHVSILHRYFPKDYQALDPNPLAETIGSRNEHGLYMGLQIKPDNHWELKGYFDIYRHPWLRSNADAPSSGYEIRGRATYTIKRKLTAYLELRNETKLINTPDNETKIDLLNESQLFQARLHVAYKASKSIEIRNRIQYGRGTFPSLDGVENGILFYQDFIFKPIGFPLSFTTRFSLFDTDSFALRFYTFENNLLYVQNAPPLSGRGARYYLNLRYRGIRNLTIEARFAQTRFTDRDAVGSGLDQSSGNKRTEVAAQLKYSF